LSLLELLAVEGSATATRCGEVLGESAASCSFHLRQLAKYGYVEEAPGGTGRQRPWRLVGPAQFGELPDTDEADRARGALSTALVERQRTEAIEWAARAGREPTEWKSAPFQFATVVWLTPDELDEMGEEILAVVRRHADRLRDPERRPRGSRPVRIFGSSFPGAAS
jgi:hypothetical protein